MEKKKAYGFRQGLSFFLVPKGGFEPPWISPNDFESFASTVPPFGQRGNYSSRADKNKEAKRKGRRSGHSIGLMGIGKHQQVMARQADQFLAMELFEGDDRQASQRLTPRFLDEFLHREERPAGRKEIIHQ